MTLKGITSRRLGIIFSVTDEDQKHFDRFLTELKRLGYPFAVNFDHCCEDTKKLFRAHPCFFADHANDDPTKLFDESHRQPALDILVKTGFEWMLSLDVDETLEKKAPEKINAILDLPDAHLVVCPCLDLWQDDKHYRIDGPFAGSRREKFFNLSKCIAEYYHPTIHAPRLVTKSNPTREVKVVMAYPPANPLTVLHWGLMTPEDLEFHCKRWDVIYHRIVGGNPYGFYPYLRDPQTVPKTAEFDYDTWR